MKGAKNAEIFEIGYSAFVMSARTVSFVLQKEYSSPKFKMWYSKKQEEMGHNGLAKFFKKERNSIEKEGINALKFSLRIQELQLSSNETQNPQNSSIKIRPNGIFYLIEKGTPKEDLIPAEISGDIRVSIPTITVDGKKYNILDACEEHHHCLTKLVEEWTGIMNQGIGTLS